MGERFDEVKLAAARLRAAEMQPFLSVALYALSPVGTRSTSTFAVDDRWRLFVNPDVLETWSVEHVAGVLLHEVGHVVRFHSSRARAAFVDESTSWLWNLAADAEINDDLLSDGVPLPSPVTPRSLGMPRGKAAEYYYARLDSRERPLARPDLDCGEGAHGVSSSGAVALVVPDGLSPEEADFLRQRIAVLINNGSAAGTIALGWSRWAAAFVQPVVDWRRLFGASLRGALSAVVAGRSDYRYHRPSRRTVPRVVLPSLVRPVPVVAVVIDTSASVDDDQLSRAWTEVRAMMSAVGVRREQVRVFSTDVDAHRLRLGNAERVELIGGGGTDMVVGIEAALAERPPPDVVVVLTDGYTPWPDTAPRRSVIIGLLAPPDDADAYEDEDPWTPEWATVVRLTL